jgi:hypothetical protein
MQNISLMSATAGMVLARDVFREDSPNGMPICGKGTEITDSLITRFERMNVQTIYVEGHPVREEGEQTLADLHRDLDDRFNKTLLEPYNRMLHSIYKAYLAKSKGGAGEQKAE